MTIDRDLLTLADANMCGFKIVINNNLPIDAKISISDDFKWCSDEFRESFKQWSIDTFGPVHNIYLMEEEKTIFMNSEQYAMLRKQLL